MLVFEWDDEKALANLAKHGVPLEAGQQIFGDPRRVDFDVSRAVDGEVRRKVVGLVGRRLWALVYTPRGDALRLISVRPANRSEIERYGDR